MRRIIGVTTAEHIAAGVVQGNQLAGPIRVYPGEDSGGGDPLATMPSDEIAQCIRREIEALAAGGPVDAVGIGFPGIIRAGIIEESPNLQQLKGARMQEAISSALAEAGIHVPVFIYNDADIVAAGLAAARGQLDQHIRVWTLGNGVGFGVYPWREGVWEGGHIAVGRPAGINAHTLREQSATPPRSSRFHGRKKASRLLTA